MLKKLKYPVIAIVLCFACHKKDVVNPQPIDNISNSAFGSIDKQNDGSSPKVTYIVDSAHLSALPDSRYKLFYRFESHDSVSIIIRKATNDYNYHFPKPNEENQLLFFIFNQDTLGLSESALSLQPRNGSVYETVVNVHTLVHGDFNGTVKSVSGIAIY